MAQKAAVKTKTKTKTKTSARAALTPDEQKLQLERGALYRSLVVKATGEQLKGVNTDKVGIMLSGGVDSTTVLWALLENGVRPYVYTFRMPTITGLSNDGQRAKALAEHYGLPFRIVEMPDDAEALAQIIKDISDNHPSLDSRADFEVMPIFRQMYIEARDKDGVRDLFSGIGEGALYLLGRKMEIRARTGKMSLAETDARRLAQMVSDQHIVLAAIATEEGVRLRLPLLMAASCQPYHGVPWHVMHTPRNKAITMSAWSAEESISQAKIVVAPLQCGDSGAREYYDGYLRRSLTAASVCGRQPSSAIVYYNYLRSRWFEHEPNTEKAWDWFSHVTSGYPLPADVKPMADPVTGRAPMPEEPDEESIFDVFDDPIVRDADGNPDTRVDCFGVPFYKGDAECYTKCLRAQAGLCGKHDPDHPYVASDCETWSVWTDNLMEYLDNMAEVSTGTAATAYSEWKNTVRESIEKVALAEHQSL